jgi:hypothetical protein
MCRNHFNKLTAFVAVAKPRISRGSVQLGIKTSASGEQ